MALQLIKYDPNDYKLGNALALRSHEIVTSQEILSQLFSLFFQWKERSTCWAYTTKDKLLKLKVDLSYDEEERVATQFYVKFEGETPPQGDWVFLRVEVFNNCFEVESKALEWFIEGNEATAIIEVPTEASIIKTRQYARIKAIGDSTVHLEIDGERSTYELHQVSLNSCIVKATIPSRQKVKLLLGDGEIIGETTRSFDEFTSIKLHIDDDQSHSRWFWEYCKHTYPDLRQRSDLRYEDCIQLYRSSGYFERYNVDEVDSSQLLEAAWDEIKDFEKLVSADCAVVQDGKPVGIGSTTYTYHYMGKEYWTFHSLCTLTKDENLDMTRALYAWRAEYNFSKPSEIDTLLFFASRSRWIERIYINFLLRKQKSGVVPIRLYTLTFEPRDHGVNVEKIELKNGVERYVASLPGVAAAALPDLLHVRGKLNCIDVSDEGKTEDAIKVGEQLAHSAGRSLSFRVSLPDKHCWVPMGNCDSPSDRLGILRKEDLPDFIASLDHSIEVTKKKYQK